MAIFEKALEANVMSTKMLIRADVSKRILLEAYTLAKEFEKRYSAYIKESFLNTVNAMAGIEALPATPEDIELFTRSITASEHTNGVFDITIGALSHGAYHFGFSNQQIAVPHVIAKQKELVNYKEFLVTSQDVFLKRQGMRLDLGGIGKGYAAKKIAAFLLEKGAKKLLVNVGGEIVSYGKSYRISLLDPFSKESFLFFDTTKDVTSISTSGDYERFIGSKENNHILDINKGTSANRYSSMSIIQNSFDIDLLDAYATAMFNSDLDSIHSYAKKLDFSVILIDKDAGCSMINTKKLLYRSMNIFPFSS